MKKLVLALLALFLFAAAASAQSVTMTTAQKVQLTAAAVDTAGAPVTIPQSTVVMQWSSNCATCTFTGGGYDAATKAWSTWFNAGTDLGTFTVTMMVTYNTTGQKFTATQSVTINEVIVIPASVKIVPGTPVNK